MVGKLSTNLPWPLANPLWAQQINALIGDVDEIMSVPFIQGYLLSGIVLSASTPKAIPHNLGVVPMGWILTDNQASATVWRVSWTAQVITLEASANTTINVWVF